MLDGEAGYRAVPRLVRWEGEARYAGHSATGLAGWRSTSLKGAMTLVGAWQPGLLMLLLRACLLPIRQSISC